MSSAMQVTVHYLAQLRRAAGCPAERVEVEPGCTVAALLDRLGERHGAPFRALIHPSLLFFVGDQPADRGTVLADGAELTILAPMSGGAPT